MRLASRILWGKVKAQHLWVLSAKYDGPTARMWPNASKAISSWVPQTQRGNHRERSSQKGLWIQLQPNSLYLALHTNKIAHLSLSPGGKSSMTISSMSQCTHSVLSWCLTFSQLQR
jgi:hypothetical protein